MKTLMCVGMYVMFVIGVNAQTTTTNSSKNQYPQNHKQHTTPVKTSSRVTRGGADNSPAVSPTPNNRPTTTDRRNPGSAHTPGANNPSTSNQQKAQPKSPFVGGIYAAPNASRTYDTIITNGPESSTMVGTVIPGGNDTTFNINTVTTTPGVTTTSGAVDRSGQAQFGQTNWGRSERNTVGESQWTIPPPITASFNREFPATNNAVWTRNQVDTNTYSVRYKTGANWVTSTYDASGTRINMRTDVPLAQPPAAVTVFLAKQPASFRIVSISRLQLQGRPEVYEIKLASGETTYINTDGMEVKL